MGDLQSDTDTSAAPRSTRRTQRAAAVAVAVTVAVTLILAASIAYVTRSTSGNRPIADQATITQLMTIAKTAAANGGGQVESADAVRSTRSAAVRFSSGDGVSGNEPVWLVQVRGKKDFVCGTCSQPRGAGSSPRGRVIQLILDAKTFDVTDFGLDSRWLDLSPLGAVLVLKK